MRQMLNKIGEGLLGVFLRRKSKAKAYSLKCGYGPACPHSILDKAKKLSVARGEDAHRADLT